MYPILHESSWSHREDEWLLHLSALECALPLFFCYNRTSYARWGSLYSEDCLKLPTKFAEIYKEFPRGPFVVNFSPRDFEILGWCPAGPVLPHGEKVPL